MCFHMSYAVFWAHKVLYLGHPLPDTSSKGNYYRDFIFTTSSNPKSQMSLGDHMDAFREAYEAAEYAKNGQVTHRMRHQVPTELRLRYNAPTEMIEVLGWNNSVMTHVYARLPPTDLLAKLAGSPDRQGYTVVWLLLDPLALDEFRSMVQEVYEQVQEKLNDLREVRLCESFASQSKVFF